MKSENRIDAERKQNDIVKRTSISIP